MAIDIAGLFATPEQYQMQQAAQAQEQARLFGLMTPAQQVASGAFLGGSQLGSGIAGVFGGQDPQLRMISARQAILRQVDPNNPASFIQAAQAAAAAGDSQLAMALANQGQAAQLGAAKLASEEALAAQRSTPEKVRVAEQLGALTRQREMEALMKGVDHPDVKQLDSQIASLSRAARNESTPADIIKAERIASSEGLVPDTPEFEKRVGEVLLGTQKTESFGVEAERKARELFGKPYAQLTQPEMAEVNAVIQRGKESVASVGVRPVPGEGKQGVTEIPEFRNKVIASVKPYRDSIYAVDQASTALDLALRENNSVAFNAARVQLAKSLGDSQLSRRDIEAAGGDPSIAGRLVDTTSVLFTGTPSKDTLSKIRKTLEAARKVAAKKANEELASQRKLAKRVYPEDVVNDIFDFPMFSETAPASAASMPSDSGAVDWNTLPTKRKQPAR